MSNKAMDDWWANGCINPRRPNLARPAVYADLFGVTVVDHAPAQMATRPDPLTVEDRWIASDTDETLDEFAAREAKGVVATGTPIRIDEWHEVPRQFGRGP